PDGAVAASGGQHRAIVRQGHRVDPPAVPAAVEHAARCMFLDAPALHGAVPGADDQVFTVSREGERHDAALAEALVYRGARHARVTRPCSRGEVPYLQGPVAAPGGQVAAVAREGDAVPAATGAGTVREQEARTKGRLQD